MELKGNRSLTAVQAYAHRLRESRKRPKSV